jgi:hypothetical protein
MVRGITPQLALVDEIPEPSLPRDQIMIHVFNGDPLRDGSAVDVYLGNVLLAANLPVGAVSTFSVTTPGDARCASSALEVHRRPSSGCEVKSSPPVPARSFWSSAADIAPGCFAVSRVADG